MFVLVNLKAYPCDPVAVAEAAAAVAEDSGVRVAVAPQAADLSAVAETGVETWAQHVSPVEHGSHTGSTLAERAKRIQAGGTLLQPTAPPRQMLTLGCFQPQGKPLQSSAVPAQAHTGLLRVEPRLEPGQTLTLPLQQPTQG
jgi:hypothetical protein